MKLHAIVNAYGEPYEETCLCDQHFTDNNKNWHELSYKKARWKEFEAAKKNVDYADIVCVICGYPIGSEDKNTD